MVQFGGKDAGGYEYLWWVEYGGNIYPRLLFQECILHRAPAATMFL